MDRIYRCIQCYKIASKGELLCYECDKKFIGEQQELMESNKKIKSVNKKNKYNRERHRKIKKQNIIDNNNN